MVDCIGSALCLDFFMNMILVEKKGCIYRVVLTALQKNLLHYKLSLIQNTPPHPPKVTFDAYINIAKSLYIHIPIHKSFSRLPSVLAVTYSRDPYILLFVFKIYCILTTPSHTNQTTTPITIALLSLPTYYLHLSKINQILQRFRNSYVFYSI